MNVFSGLAHVRHLSKMMPRYLSVSEFDIGLLFICTGGGWLLLRAKVVCTDLLSLFWGGSTSVIGNMNSNRIRVLKIIIIH